MRAEQALAALRNHDFLHVVTDDDTEPEACEVPYGWALWRPDGALYFCLRADQAPGRTDGWDAICSVINVDPERRTEGWEVDPISEDDYATLNANKPSFEHPDMRDEFLSMTKMADDRAAQGLRPLTGFAAWAEGGLIALHPAVRGLNGWHSLGIGKAAKHVSLIALYGEEYMQVSTYLDSYRGPNGEMAFLAWRQRNEIAEGQQVDTGFSLLAHAFSGAIFDYADADYGGTPSLVLGQYLEDCLAAYSAALKNRQEVPT